MTGQTAMLLTWRKRPARPTTGPRVPPLVCTDGCALLPIDASISARVNCKISGAISSVLAWCHVITLHAARNATLELTPPCPHPSALPKLRGIDL